MEALPQRTRIVDLRTGVEDDRLHKQALPKTQTLNACKRQKVAKPPALRPAPGVSNLSVRVD
jgi:hypothetical protein